MDECQNPLSCLIANENPSTCSNTFGSFTCECNDGFEQISESSPVCQDINECEVGCTTIFQVAKNQLIKSRKKLKSQNLLQI